MDKRFVTSDRLLVEVADLTSQSHRIGSSWCSSRSRRIIRDTPNGFRNIDGQCLWCPRGAHCAEEIRGEFLVGFWETPVILQGRHSRAAEARIRSRAGEHDLDPD